MTSVVSQVEGVMSVPGQNDEDKVTEEEFEITEGMKNKSWRPLEGQLTKFTNVVKGWQHRWFILDPESGMLEYFEKEEHKKQRARGSLHLAAAVISPSDEDSQTFAVSASNGEVFKLRATDAKERQQWVDRLRSSAEYHTTCMAQNRPRLSLSRPRPQSTPVPYQTKETRPSSAVVTGSSASLGPPVTHQRSRRGSHGGSSENVHNTSPDKPRASQVVSQRAPMARPHTIDPFREVKEYMMEAEDYSHHLTDKINALPQSGEKICGLDEDILLIKATSSATLTCLTQCLTMLQQRQEAYGGLSDGLPATASASLDTEIRPRLHIPDAASRSGSIVENNNPSPAGSFTSASSLPYSLTDSTQPDGPIKHEDEVEDEAEYKDSELTGVEEHKSIILHLLSQLKLGMDLTKVVLPTFILERRSLLELFADCMAHPDVFLRITNLSEPEERMMAVLEWYLTSFHAGRQGSIAKKPYNPIIGETFHCSWQIPQESVGENGDQETKPLLMTYTAEQVSHHPPVSAFYFECPGRNVCINASIWTKSKFMGMSIGVVMVGKVSLKLLDFDEEYVFSLPSAYARSILTTPWVELGDKINMTCQKTNMAAAVTFHTKPFYGGKLHRVTAEVKNNTTGNICCKVQGEWNANLEFTYTNQEMKTIDVHQNKIWRKRVRPLNLQGDFESRRLWQHVTNALKIQDVNTATEHKHFLEERQREGERHRRDTSTQFPTKYFQKVGDTWVYRNMLQKKS